ncbi:hypothetical protein M9H77_24479 [Catharanthus roseus]|uniref:Uncharacterized protein n=1 Tax=Catharanthus roseus TaxID=4058 RepID=A0ACC0AWL7_CATRO|nr:hypothetical protein M9H77_24479 [Catharanthus roseus]
MGRHSCCIKQKLRKGLWSPEEDEKLYNYITRFGVGCWSSVPKLAGLQRCGKSCRLRWINYLRPDLKRGMFSQQEEDLIIRLHEILGNRWAQIAAQLPGRTDNEIKNFWNSSLKKKLIKQGIDPNTHQPIIENEAKEEKICKENASLQISHSSSTSSGVINTDFGSTGQQLQPVSNNNDNNKQVFDPFFLLEFQANVDPCGYNSSFLNYNGSNLTTLDQKARTETDFSDTQMINSNMAEENAKAAAISSWDSSDNHKFDSVYNQYQLINGIKVEQHHHNHQVMKPIISPWQENSLGDFSEYPLATTTTSLSGEDLNGTNVLDHVFNHL